LSGGAHRAVAVATQSPHGEIGQSLTNAAERYAAAVWTEFFADQDQPPIWIERSLLAGAFEDEFVLVTFDVVDGCTLGGPDWNTITSGELGLVVRRPHRHRISTSRRGRPRRTC